MTGMPYEVESPEWETYPEHKVITMTGGKVTGRLEVVAMDLDDIYVEGELTYRGHTYKVKHEHVTMAGEPKGYEYGEAGEGQVYRVLRNDWAKRRFFSPEAPNTYFVPLLAAVAESVAIYVANFPDHVRAGVLAGLRQRVNSRASTYNDKAKELLGKLGEYRLATDALEKFENKA